MQEVNDALEWIKTSFNASAPSKTSGTSQFEATIRILGGLLSAYQLQGGNQMLLAAAIEAGIRLLAAFNTRHGLPNAQVRLQIGPSSSQISSQNSLLLAGVGTLSVEFAYLAQVRLPLVSIYICTRVGLSAWYRCVCQQVHLHNIQSHVASMGSAAVCTKDV